ncbi:hypothetical protein ACQU0X_25580 [Pseudovibrio ascidiaceicola]|uniref:DUF5983 family protein n=1 Tax=Pseudovibrio ascidiaceicola TaxID=285279 RepID=UPI003D36F257
MSLALTEAFECAIATIAALAAPLKDQAGENPSEEVASALSALNSFEAQKPELRAQVARVQGLAKEIDWLSAEDIFTDAEECESKVSQLVNQCTELGKLVSSDNRDTKIRQLSALELSTVHLGVQTRNDLEKCTTETFPVFGGHTNHGYFLRATSDTDYRQEPLPNDLRACTRYARALGFSYILFDENVPVIDGLPVYEEVMDEET